MMYIVFILSLQWNFLSKLLKVFSSDTFFFHVKVEGTCLHKDVLPENLQNQIYVWQVGMRTWKIYQHLIHWNKNKQQIQILLSQKNPALDKIKRVQYFWCKEGHERSSAAVHCSKPVCILCSGPAYYCTDCIISLDAD